MAKYQIKAALLAPSGNYDETTDPKAVADFKALDKAYEEKGIETMHNILTDYGILNGAVEEHDDEFDSDTIIVCDRDGYYLLEKIRE